MASLAHHSEHLHAHTLGSSGNFRSAYPEDSERLQLPDRRAEVTTIYAMRKTRAKESLR
jgi:hypothetical protein